MYTVLGYHDMTNHLKIMIVKGNVKDLELVDEKSLTDIYFRYIIHSNGGIDFGIDKFAIELTSMLLGKPSVEYEGLIKEVKMEGVTIPFNFSADVVKLVWYTDDERAITTLKRLFDILTVFTAITELHGVNDVLAFTFKGLLLDVRKSDSKINALKKIDNFIKFLEFWREVHSSTTFYDREVMKGTMFALYDVLYKTCYDYDPNDVVRVGKAIDDVVGMSKASLSFTSTSKDVIMPKLINVNGTNYIIIRIPSGGLIAIREDGKVRYYSTIEWYYIMDLITNILGKFKERCVSSVLKKNVIRSIIYTITEAISRGVIPRDVGERIIGELTARCVLKNI